MSGEPDRVDVFVSHASGDRSWAVWIDWVLRNELGLTTICDVYDFSIGENFVVKMSDALDRADRVVLLVSPRSVGRRFVEDEWTSVFASRRGALIPVVIEAAEMPSLLAPILRVDLVGLDDDERVAELRRIVAAPERPTVRPASPTAALERREVPRSPSCSTVLGPHVPPRNPFFTGRERVLDDLRSSVGSGTAVVLQAIAGLGGVGKTGVATEHCYRSLGEVDVIWWLRAENPDIARADLGALATERGVALDGMALDDRVAAAMRWLETTDCSWILVIDNLDDPAVLSALRPRVGRGQVLVTTRSQVGFGPTVQVSEVDAFDPETAVAFAQSRLPRSSRDDVVQLAARMGGLALAIEQAAAYLLDSQSSVSDYLTSLEREGLGAGDWAAADPARTVRAVISGSLDRVGTGATAVLGVMAVVAPEVVPITLVAAALADPTALDRGIVAGRRLSLINRDGEGLVAHRLTLEVTRQRISPDERADTSARIVQALLNTWPTDTDHPDSWGTCAKLLPHALAATAIDGDGDLPTARLRSNLSRYLAAMGDYRRAVPLAEQVLNDRERVLGVDHPETIGARYNLSICYGQVGDYQRAVPLAEQVLNDYERVLGVDHPDSIRARELVESDRYRAANSDESS